MATSATRKKKFPEILHPTVINQQKWGPYDERKEKGKDISERYISTTMATLGLRNQTV